MSGKVLFFNQFHVSKLVRQGLVRQGQVFFVPIYLYKCADLQGKGFSPVCVLLWSFRESFFFNTLTKGIAKSRSWIELCYYITNVVTVGS